MALPSSGSISMGDINVEMGRSRTFSNTTLAGSGTPPASGSLVASYAAVNQVSPFAISEFYGKSYGWVVSIQVKKEASTTIPALRIYYKIGVGGSWTLFFNSSVGTTYTSAGDIIVPPSNVLYLSVQNTSDQNVTFGQGNGGLYTGFCGQSSPYSFTVSANSTQYLNARVVSSALVTC